MATKNQIIGHATCPDCGAKVERRINKNRKVYWFCDGAADDLQCSAGFKHGGAKSRRLIAEAAISNDNQPKEKTNAEQNTGKPTNDNPDSKRQSGKTEPVRDRGFGLFGG